jgi:GT2 family glycosyltransferase
MVDVYLWMYHTDLWNEFHNLLSPIKKDIVLHLGLCHDTLSKEVVSLAERGFSNLQISEHPNAGAELYSDGTGRNKGRHQDANDIQFNIPHYTGYCSGCLLYMRRDAIEKLGPLSKKLDKMYYEDSEWQYRAHINGLKTIYEPRCVAIHDEGSSSGTDITKGMKKYQEINRVKFLNLMKDQNCSDIERYNN